MSSPKSNTPNFLAPISVGLVVITLGAAFGVLSGRGALIGMASTCVITLISALAGGSRYGVSSPTGPMTAAIGAILVLDTLWLQSHHVNLDPVGLMNLTLLAAAGFLILFLLLRVQRFVRYIPNLVISGFINGIAMMIVISQMKSIVGFYDVGLMITTFGVALAMDQITQKTTHLVWKLLCDSLFVIIAMSLITWALQLPVEFLDMSGGSVFEAWALPPVGAINWETLGIIIPLALELALIALLDTLLTAVIIDQKSNTISHMTRELGGQSLSLGVLSFFGGIPGAQSTVPSIMLWQEGGHHRFSKMALALICIVLTFLLSDAVQFVPEAVFGGIILKIAFDVADGTSVFTVLFASTKMKWVQLFIITGTILVTVGFSLNVAVIAFTLFFLGWNRIAQKSFLIPDLLPHTESEGVEDEI